VTPFQNGLAVAVKGDKSVLLDRTGKEVAPPKYDTIYEFSEGLARVVTSNKWGYIDRTGKEAVAPQYAQAAPFSEGLAAVQKDWLWGYIDKTGKMVIEPKFKNADRFSEGLAKIGIPNAQNINWGDTIGYINAEGSNLLQTVGGNWAACDAGTACFDGWILFLKTIAGGGMVVQDKTLARGALVMPVKNTYQWHVGKKFAIERVNSRLLRLKMGDAVGYFDTETATALWRAEE
jgi:hypothetical protein